MNRRDFLTLGTKETPEKYPLDNKDNPYRNSALPKGFDVSNYSVAPFVGQWSAQQAMHLLRRATFGYTLSSIQGFASKTMEQAVDDLLNIQNFNPSPPVNNYNGPGQIDPNIAEGQTWVYDTINPPEVNFPRISSFKSWSIGLMFNQDNDIREKMTLFWHNHFATEADVVTDGRATYKLNQYLRENCLGNFKQMVKDVSKDPSMLYYLNGYRNTKTAPDENYARELFELFTLGKDSDSQYTESDVIESAKVLTGWRINPATLESFFQANLHETSNKIFSSFFNNTVITGKVGPNGALEKDELVDMIFTKEQVVAKFLCRKIYRFFCYYVIDSQTETDVIAPLAQTLIDNNWEIKPVMAKLFKSQHFFDTNSKACQIKNPFDYFIGFGRLFDVIIPPTLKQEYHAWLIVNFVCSAQGMDYCDPPSVAGWPAYYQTPQYHQLWINSDTLTKRKQLMEAILLPDGLVLQGTSLKVDLISFVEQLTTPGNPNLLIDQAVEICCAFPVSDAKKAEMKGILLGGQTQDFYWTGAWDTLKADTSNAQNRLVVYVRLFSMFQYLLSLPEYQLA